MKTLLKSVYSKWLLSFMFIFVMWDTGLIVSSTPITVKWDAPSINDIYGPAEFYDVRITTVVRTIPRTYTYRTTNQSITINRPSVDFFDVAVRAGNSFGIGEWAQSIDPSVAIFNGQPKGWRIYFMLPPPGGGGID